MGFRLVPFRGSTYIKGRGYTNPLQYPVTMQASKRNSSSLQSWPPNLSTVMGIDLLTHNF